MIFCYMDEAGNTGENIADPTQPFHYVGGLLVEDKHWKGIARAMRGIAVDALGTAAVLTPGFKFHGSFLYAGKSPWDGIDKVDRIEIFRSCLSLIEKYECRLIYGRCDKVKLQRYRSPMHPHSIAVWLCCERGAQYANRVQSLISFIAASGGRNLSKIASDVLANYRQKGPPFGNAVSLDNVVDSVHFVPSEDSYHLQLCDLWLWVINRHHCQKYASIEIQELVRIFRKQIFSTASFPY